MVCFFFCREQPPEDGLTPTFNFLGVLAFHLVQFVAHMGSPLSARLVKAEGKVLIVNPQKAARPDVPRLRLKEQLPEQTFVLHETARGRQCLRLPIGR